MKSKKLTSLLFGCLLAATGMAQVPQGISYQAVLRDGTGAIEANTGGTLGLAILQGSNSGTVVYSETHAVTSNGFGLVNVVLGGGTVVTGDFSTIDWSTGAYWVRTTFNGTELGTSKLQSVPFALYAPGGASLNGTTNNLVKFTGANTGGNSNIFDDGTRVGVGTTTPDGLLAVKGAGFSNVPQLTLAENTAGYSRLRFQNSNAGGWVLAGTRSSDAPTSLLNVFYSEEAGTINGSNVLQISGQGKVGINGADPTSSDLSTGTLGVKQYGQSDALTLYNSDDIEYWGFYVGPSSLSLWNTGILKGSFDNTTGAYSTTSDTRLKENITPVTNVLDRLKDVQVMNYTYKADKAHRPQLGYIAQNLEEHFPEFVTKPLAVDGKESYYTVNYAGMSAVAIKAIQEQQELIGAMAKTIDELKARVGQLEAR
ncbi:MAG: tail fiber domain-containing protein [Flavobacteriales bacterium]|nr:tail fiber domain-containing protein [Flavobacteriales bacterium]MEB2342409.1 tail fiber domain-containing protein [Flavobacteriia bacterium]